MLTKEAFPTGKLLQIVEKPRHFETWVSFLHHNALVSGEAGGLPL
ncbi:hypothetical protein JOD82_005681, partial [Paenibacillus sp. 1182]|nr:hypothetical protein [Paenibacillus sp. 1182]